MDTSDSEYFESADEEFMSGDENMSKTTQVKKKELIKKVIHATSNLKILDITRNSENRTETDETQEKEVADLTKNKRSNTSSGSIKTSEFKNVTREESKPKLGAKLGSKVNKNVSGDQKKEKVKPVKGSVNASAQEKLLSQANVTNECRIEGETLITEIERPVLVECSVDDLKPKIYCTAKPNIRKDAVEEPMNYGSKVTYPERGSNLKGDPKTSSQNELKQSKMLAKTSNECIPQASQEVNEENMWEEDDWEPMNHKSVVTPPEQPSNLQEDCKSSQNALKQPESLLNSTNQTSKNVKRENMWEDDIWEPVNVSQPVTQASKNVIEENMWEDNDWEPVNDKNDLKLARDLQEVQTADNSSTWSAWGNWGSSILSTTSQGVTSLTKTVSQGLNNVLETGLGVPDPQELARLHKAEHEKFKSFEPTEEHKDTEEETKKTVNLGFGIGNFYNGVTQITKLVETTSNKVISGGLDTLETIGKKTMEVLQEGDPGLKKKRAFLKIDQEKPVLSQLLREAKDKAEEDNKFLEEKNYSKKANYEMLFDDHQGLVHLEALEMLSKQCDIKLQTLSESYSDKALTEMQETMTQVKELCELPEDDEDETFSTVDMQEKLEIAVGELNVPISYCKLMGTWEEKERWLENASVDVCNEREMHEQAIHTLAQLTAIAVEQFHKAGELLLIKEHRSTADEADSLVQLTTILTGLIGHTAAKFSESLSNLASNGNKNKDTINSLITNIYFEAANSSSYIKDAFQLLLPVLQVGAV